LPYAESYTTMAFIVNTLLLSVLFQKLLLSRLQPSL
jgi:hypothetical protein